MLARKNIVNPDFVTAYGFEGYPDYTCVWDVAVSPEGDIYTSLCTEGMPAGLNARLFKKPAGSDRLVECVSNRRVTCQSPENGQMPHSKIHTSMQLDTDGKLYYITYTTSPGVGHEFWDVFQLFDDPVQGYPGSHFAEYDTQTGRYATWGTPAPRHMIYGGMLDSERRRYYYLVWIPGRLGYVDLDERRFVDVGRVCRRHSFGMFMDALHRVFGITREGQIWRCDPDTNRVEMLERWLPRRDDEPLEMYIYQVNTREDGMIVGGCRSGLPLWIYDPMDGDQGAVHSLGNPWPDLPDGSFDTGWATLLGKDGYLYYWTKTVVGEDIHLVRMDLATRSREDLGLGYIDGKALGTWMGPGTVGADGKLYWGDSAYYQPRVIVVDPSRIGANPSPVEAEVELPETVPTPTGAPITVHPLDASWTDQAVPRDRLRVIPVCGHSAPHGSCAMTSLAATPDGRILGIASGRSCSLIAFDPRRDKATTRVFDSGIEGSAYHSLSVSPSGDAVFGVDPADSGCPAPIFEMKSDGRVSRICAISDGVRTLTADWDRGLIYVLTKRGNRLVALDVGGGTVFETDSICDRQLSPTLTLDCGGNLFGAQRGGRVWTLAQGTRSIETLDLPIPCLKGRAYLVEWQAAVNSGQWIYGSSSDGYLFRLDPSSMQLVNLGKPVVELGLRALAAAPDGSVYGVGGAPEYGIPHVFRYHPNSGFEDIGQLDYLLHPYGIAVRVACMACTNDGVIYIGEDDDISHLWEYQEL